MKEVTQKEVNELFQRIIDTYPERIIELCNYQIHMYFPGWDNMVKYFKLEEKKVTGKVKKVIKEIEDEFIPDEYTGRPKGL